MAGATVRKGNLTLVQPGPEIEDEGPTTKRTNKDLTAPDFGLVALPKFPSTVAWVEPLTEYRDAVLPNLEVAEEFHYASSMTVIGHILGRNYYVSYPDPVYCNFFSCLVGPTGRSRKTTAMRQADGHLFQPLIKRSPGRRSYYKVNSGLPGSGEGMMEEIADGKSITGRQSMIFLDEISPLFRKMRIENSTLGSVLIQLADGNPLITLRTRKSQLTATNTLVSLLAASTESWLERDVRFEDVQGGLINRFLWFTGEYEGRRISRPKVDRKALDQMIKGFDWVPKKPQKVAIEFDLTRDAEDRLEEWYIDFTSRVFVSDIVASLTARIPTHTMRLALFYAVLDQAGDPWIDIHHLEAGIEVAEYCSEVVQHLFLTMSPNPDVQTERAMIRYLKDMGPMSLKRLKDEAVPWVPGAKMKGLLKALQSLGYVEVNWQNRTVGIMPKKVKGKKRGK